MARPRAGRATAPPARPSAARPRSWHCCLAWPARARPAVARPSATSPQWWHDLPVPWLFLGQRHQ
eukprot:5601371-Lingulodinium_polyedra.AAC.1